MKTGKFWDTRINNPFWKLVDFLYDLWDWVCGRG